MIPCHICGKDASLGWITGLPPAPDSQKMALCAVHDTLANRATVSREWQKMMAGDIEAVTTVARHKADVDAKTVLVTVRFTGGGMLSFTGVDCKPTEQNTLRIEEADGSLTFIPLQQVREYTVSPALPPDMARAENAPDKK